MRIYDKPAVVCVIQHTLRNNDCSLCSVCVVCPCCSFTVSVRPQLLCVNTLVSTTHLQITTSTACNLPRLLLVECTTCELFKLLVYLHHIHHSSCPLPRCAPASISPSAPLFNILDLPDKLFLTPSCRPTLHDFVLTTAS